MLTEQQQDEFVGVLAVGCAPQTAAAAVGASLGEVAATLRASREFATRTARVEALLEVVHMKSVKQASVDAKNWRASVWWLERRRPERYARRDPQAIQPEEYRQLLADLIRAVADEVHDTGDRTRVINRLTRNRLFRQAG